MIKIKSLFLQLLSLKVIALGARELHLISIHFQHLQERERDIEAVKKREKVVNGGNNDLLLLDFYYEINLFRGKVRWLVDIIFVFGLYIKKKIEFCGVRVLKFDGFN